MNGCISRLALLERLQGTRKRADGKIEGQELIKQYSC